MSVEVFFPPRSLPTKTRASPKEDEVKVDGKEEQSEREMLAGESNDGNGNDDTSFEFDSILRDTPEQHNRGAFIATSDSLWGKLTQKTGVCWPYAERTREKETNIGLLIWT